MTVCIAARAGHYIVGALDRMLTSADIEFEPSAGMKLIVLSSSIFIMTSGDSALQTEIVGRVHGEVTGRIAREPQNWWLVKDVAELYVKNYNSVKAMRAESAILAPLNLTHDSFVMSQKIMNDALVSDLAKELLNFKLPDVSIIVAGIDPLGSHIYAVHDNESYCLDGVGFSAIGIGGRHASSQFMFARHAWNAEIADTLILTYHAKKKAEVAPGVGGGTDMVMVGPGLGSLILLNQKTMEKLDKEHRGLVRSETTAFTRAKGQMRSYVEELARQASEAAAASNDAQAAAKSSDRTASPVQPKTAEPTSGPSSEESEPAR